MLIRINQSEKLNVNIQLNAVANMSDLDKDPAVSRDKYHTVPYPYWNTDRYDIRGTRQLIKHMQ